MFNLILVKKVIAQRRIYRKDITYKCTNRNSHDIFKLVFTQHFDCQTFFNHYLITLIRVCAFADSICNAKFQNVMYICK